jgi:hypothetical protein
MAGLSAHPFFAGIERQSPLADDVEQLFKHTIGVLTDAMTFRHFARGRDLMRRPPMQAGWRWRRAV